MDHRHKYTHTLITIMGFILILVVTGSAFATNFQVLKHNSDSFPDLLGINDSGQLVSQLGVGDGTLLAPEVISLDSSPIIIALGGFSSSSYKDLVYVDVLSTVSLAVNDGDGGFGSEVELDVGLDLLESIIDVTTGDVNGDGLVDLVVVINGVLNARVVVLENDGSNGFLPFDIYNLGLISTAVSVDVADLNNDGYGDMVVEGLLGAVYSILSDGMGGHALPSLSLPSLPTGNIYFNDYNNDSIPDLIVLDEVLGLLSIRLGVGDGSFGSATSISVGLLPNDLVMVDINGDGNDDAILINVGDNSINVLLGDGLGGLLDTVGQVLTDLLGTIGGLGLDLPMAVVSADFNGDCRLDIAIWSDLTGEYIITMNQTGPDLSELIFCSVFEDQSAN